MKYQSLVISFVDTRAMKACLLHTVCLYYDLVSKFWVNSDYQWWMYTIDDLAHKFYPDSL